MTFDEWWDTTKATATPETFAGWEQSCRQAWRAGQLAERERCAKLAETVHPHWIHIARAIREDRP